MWLGAGADVDGLDGTGGRAAVAGAPDGAAVERVADGDVPVGAGASADGEEVSAGAVRAVESGVPEQPASARTSAARAPTTGPGLVGMSEGRRVTLISAKRPIPPEMFPGAPDGVRRPR